MTQLQLLPYAEFCEEAMDALYDCVTDGDTPAGLLQRREEYLAEAERREPGLARRLLAVLKAEIHETDGCERWW